MKSRWWWVYAIGPIDIGWEDLVCIELDVVPWAVRAAAASLGWEGDVRGSECAKFSLPCEDDFIAGYVWKQDNNGTCFVASPVELPYLNDVTADRTVVSRLERDIA